MTTDHDPAGLDALKGIAFIVTGEGEIADIGTQQWDAFATRNEAPTLNTEAVIGHNLFDFVSGSDVRAQLQKLIHNALTIDHGPQELQFRCDSPTRMRRIHQTICAFPAVDAENSVLFQSVEIESHERPPINLFARKASLAKDAPIVNLCSWCQRVKYTPISGRSWLDTEDYTLAGGPQNAKITHCICDDCLKLQDKTMKH